MWLLWIFDRDSGVAAKSKIKPPRLDGIKTGLYSTRTPHRPNTIGLSLVRLRKVEGDTLYLSGVDLCDGTPVRLYIYIYIYIYIYTHTHTHTHTHART